MYVYFYLFPRFQILLNMSSSASLSSSSSSAAATSSSTSSAKKRGKKSKTNTVTSSNRKNENLKLTDYNLLEDIMGTTNNNLVDLTNETNNSNNDDDDYDDYNNTSNKSTNKITTENTSMSNIQLPGGIGKKAKRSNIIANGLGYKKKISNEIIKRVRLYLDAIFGILIVYAELGVRHAEYRDSIKAIPETVSTILRFNNIHFSNIFLHHSEINIIPEPLWYYIDITNSILHLFIDIRMYNDYCLKENLMHIIWPHGKIHLENLNSNVTSGKSTPTKSQIKCAVICDHVAQHIIYEYTLYILQQNNSNTNNNGISDEDYCSVYNKNRLERRILDDSDIHEGWTYHGGTTLHSIFNMELLKSSKSSTNNPLSSLYASPFNLSSSIASTSKRQNVNQQFTTLISL